MGIGINCTNEFIWVWPGILYVCAVCVVCVVCVLITHNQTLCLCLMNYCRISCLLSRECTPNTFRRCFLCCLPGQTVLCAVHPNGQQRRNPLKYSYISVASHPIVGHHECYGWLVYNGFENRKRTDPVQNTSIKCIL